MNFVALLLGLAVERLLTHLFHLREFRWLDPVFNAVFLQLRNVKQVGALLALGATAVLLILPVALVATVLEDGLFQVPYFLFAVFVLLFSLGPRDLKEEVDDYAAAVEDGNAERTRQVARELLEADPPDDIDEHVRQVERAIYVQANNRIFGVVFWFVVLGPTGAWLFRVLDLMRHHGAYRLEPDTHADHSTATAILSLHGVMAWLPARLLAVGYALAGSFEEAASDWRSYYENCAPRFFDVTNDVMSCVGCGATGQGRGSAAAAAAGAERARTAMDLVIRTLWLIWCPLIAILTLYNWLA